MTEPITRSQAIVLVEEMMKEHDRDTKVVVKELAGKVDTMNTSMVKIETTASIIAKFAGAGVIVWALKQFVDVIHLFVK